MKPRFAILIWLLAASPLWAQTEYKLVPVRVRELCSLTDDLNMSQTVATGNAAKFNAAQDDRTKNNPFTAPGGWMPMDDTFEMTNRSGGMLLGNGYSKTLPDDMYINSGESALGATPSRFVWEGADGDPMIADPGAQHVYEAFHLQARRIPGNNGGGQTYLSGATNATPIVVTTATAHNLTSGDPVRIRNVTGNTNANGNYYANVSNSTTFSLYTDSGLTTPRAGNASYTTPSSTAYCFGKMPSVGIHIETKDVLEGNNNAPGKHALRDLSFTDVPIGILFGKDLTSAYANEDTYTGFNSLHADETVWDNLSFNYPSDIQASDRRTCMYFRTIQALGFKGFCRVNGAPNEIFYFERGGIDELDVHLNGNAPQGILRIGKLDNLTHNLKFNVDGGENTTIGRNTKLLQIDQHTSGGTVNVKGTYRPAYQNYLGSTHTCTMPLVIARGACKVTLEVDGLLPGSIRMIGQSFGSAPEVHRICWVHLNNCMLLETDDPEDLIAASGNSGPYLLTWTNCQAYQIVEGSDRFEMRPLTDGAYTAQMGDVTYGP